MEGLEHQLGFTTVAPVSHVYQDATEPVARTDMS